MSKTIPNTIFSFSHHLIFFNMQVSSHSTSCQRDNETIPNAAKCLWNQYGRPSWSCRRLRCDKHSNHSTYVTLNHVLLAFASLHLRPVILSGTYIAAYTFVLCSLLFSTVYSKGIMKDTIVGCVATNVLAASVAKLLEELAPSSKGDRNHQR